MKNNKKIAPLRSVRMTGMRSAIELKTGYGVTAAPISSTKDFKIPHNTSCFTEGLYYDANNLMLYESCGSPNGESVLRVMRGPDQKVVLEKEFPEVFLEGLTVVGDLIYILTWKSGFMYILNKQTLEVVGKCYYEGEGWGLTYDGDGEYFIMSNGSDRLTWFRIIIGEKIEIKKELNIGVNYNNLNELEWVDGHIYANVWYKDEILKIYVDDSKVVDVIKLDQLRTKFENSNSGVLNGIAYDVVRNRFLITGKNWKWMYWVNHKRKRENFYYR
jgi:glutamine cyclotransferase